MPITQDTDKDDVRVKGDDGTKGGKLVGMVDNCLKVNICNVDDITDPDGDRQDFWTSNLRCEDMNASVGGVARNTTIGASFTTIYSVSGSGILSGFFVNLENADQDEWFIRLIIDGNDIFNGSSGLSIRDFDRTGANGYGFEFTGGNDNTQRTSLGFSTFENVFNFNRNIKYTSTIVIRVRKTGGSERFRAGLVQRSI